MSVESWPDRTRRASQRGSRCDAHPERPRPPRRIFLADARANSLPCPRRAPHAPSINRRRSSRPPGVFRRRADARHHAAGLLLVRARLRSTHLARRRARRVRRVARGPRSESANLLGVDRAHRWKHARSRADRRSVGAERSAMARRQFGDRIRLSARVDRHELRRPPRRPGRAGRSCGFCRWPAGRRAR